MHMDHQTSISFVILNEFRAAYYFRATIRIHVLLVARARESSKARQLVWI